ncbi:MULTISPECIES: metalloregulator ArsR/SmtB family transcription factor [Vagococcus]|uniref:ArsR/SmtB family transcription factor n=1 Tax=Vagococcus TaxID=2737 RepID=UPI002FCB7302
MTTYNNLKKEFSDLSPFLTAIGDQKRQAIIIRMLEENSCQGLQVTSLIEATQLSRPAISHHLKILKEAKLVNYYSEGKKNFYYLEHDTEEIVKLKEFLEEVIDIMNQEEA